MMRRLNTRLAAVLAAVVVTVGIATTAAAAPEPGRAASTVAEKPLRAEKKKPAAVPGSTTSAETRIQDCVNVGNSDIGRGAVLNYTAEVECLLYWAMEVTAFDTIGVNAVFDWTTHNEVVRFQQCANALGAGLVVDGRVGNNTRPHLEWWAGHSAFIC